MSRDEAHSKALDLASKDHSQPQGRGRAYYFKSGDEFDAALTMPDGVEWCATVYCTHNFTFDERNERG